MISESDGVQGTGVQAVDRQKDRTAACGLIAVAKKIFLRISPGERPGAGAGFGRNGELNASNDIGRTRLSVSCEMKTVTPGVLAVMVMVVSSA